MDEKASNAMLVAIVAVVAIVGLVMLYSNGSNREEMSVSGQAVVTCFDSDGNNPNAFGFVQAPPGSPAVADVCVDSTTVDEKYCLGGRLTSRRATCGAGLRCISQLYTLGAVSVTSGRCATSPPEICDNIDNDLDRLVDEGCDDDSDRYCDAAMTKPVGVSVSICVGTPSAADHGNDCNDNDRTIFPGSGDLTCDGIDQDCSGHDGTPDNQEFCDNIDNNCDGIVDGTALAPNVCITCTDSDGGNNPSVGGFARNWQMRYDGRIYDSPYQTYDFCESSTMLNESVCVPDRRLSRQTLSAFARIDCAASSLRCISAGSGAYCG